MSRLLDEATRLERIGPGRYARALEKGPFWGMSTAHGGYLMALLLQAMRLEVDDSARRPRMHAQQFLGRVRPGPAEIDVTIERIGRGVTSVSSRLRCGEDPIGVATALFALPGEGPGFLDEPAPAVAPPGAPDRDLLGFMTPVHELFDYHRRFGEDGPVVPVEDGGWIVAKEPSAWDHRLALLASDLWVPAIVRHPERVCATPSLHHVVHFGPDVEGDAATPLLVRHRLSSGAEGLTDEDIGLWAGDGRLLLRARQLRSVVPVDRALGR